MQGSLGEQESRIFSFSVVRQSKERTAILLTGKCCTCHHHRPKTSSFAYKSFQTAFISLFLFMTSAIFLASLWRSQIHLGLLPFPNSHNQSVPMYQINHPFFRESSISPLLLVLTQHINSTPYHFTARLKSTATKPLCSSQIPLFHVSCSENFQGFPTNCRRYFKTFILLLKVSHSGLCG